MISVVIFIQSIHITYHQNAHEFGGYTAGFGAIGTPQLQHKMVAYKSVRTFVPGDDAPAETED